MDTFPAASLNLCDSATIVEYCHQQNEGLAVSKNTVLIDLRKNAEKNVKIESACFLAPQPNEIVWPKLLSNDGQDIDPLRYSIWANIEEERLENITRALLVDNAGAHWQFSGKDTYEEYNCFGIFCESKCSKRVFNISPIESVAFKTAEVSLRNKDSVKTAVAKTRRALIRFGTALHYVVPLSYACTRKIIILLEREKTRTENENSEYIEREERWLIEESELDDILLRLRVAAAIARQEGVLYERKLDRRFEEWYEILQMSHAWDGEDDDEASVGVVEEKAEMSCDEIMEYSNDACSSSPPPPESVLDKTESDPIVGFISLSPPDLTPKKGKDENENLDLIRISPPPLPPKPTAVQKEEILLLDLDFSPEKSLQSKPQPPQRPDKNVIAHLRTLVIEAENAARLQYWNDGGGTLQLVNADDDSSFSVDSQERSLISKREILRKTDDSILSLFTSKLKMIALDMIENADLDFDGKIWKGKTVKKFLRNHSSSADSESSITCNADGEYSTEDDQLFQGRSLLSNGRHVGSGSPLSNRKEEKNSFDTYGLDFEAEKRIFVLEVAKYLARLEVVAETNPIIIQNIIENHLFTSRVYSKKEAQIKARVVTASLIEDSHTGKLDKSEDSFKLENFIEQGAIKAAIRAIQTGATQLEVKLSAERATSLLYSDLYRTTAKSEEVKGLVLQLNEIAARAIPQALQQDEEDRNAVSFGNSTAGGVTFSPPQEKKRAKPMIWTHKIQIQGARKLKSFKVTSRSGEEGVVNPLMNDNDVSQATNKSKNKTENEKKGQYRDEFIEELISRNNDAYEAKNSIDTTLNNPIFVEGKLPLVNVALEMENIEKGDYKSEAKRTIAYYKHVERYGTPHVLQVLYEKGVAWRNSPRFSDRNTCKPGPIGGDAVHVIDNMVCPETGIDMVFVRALNDGIYGWLPLTTTPRDGLDILLIPCQKKIPELPLLWNSEPWSFTFGRILMGLSPLLQNKNNEKDSGVFLLGGKGFSDVKKFISK
eukprot:g5022.t1